MLLLSALKIPKNKNHWIKIGQISSAKGLDGRFLLHRTPLLNPAILPQTSEARIGEEPAAGVPAHILNLSVMEDESIEIKLNSLLSPEDVSQFYRQSIWVEKSTLKLASPDEIHVTELVGKSVVYVHSQEVAGRILEISHYGASYVATIKGKEGTIDLPIVDEYFEFKNLYETGVVSLLKSPSDLGDLWEAIIP